MRTLEPARLPRHVAVCLHAPTAARRAATAPLTRCQADRADRSWHQAAVALLSSATLQLHVQPALAVGAATTDARSEALPGPPEPATTKVYVKPCLLQRYNN